MIVVKATHNLAVIAVPPCQQAVRKIQDNELLLAENTVQQNVAVEEAPWNRIDPHQAE
jgi:hypothetical protein